MPDNWGFVLVAYAIAALLLGGYWRYLGPKAQELAELKRRREQPRR